jgi:serine acetyltransferase
VEVTDVLSDSVAVGIPAKIRRRTDLDVEAR